MGTYEEALPDLEDGLEPADLNAAMVAEMLGVSEPTVARLAREGDLPSVKIGHRTVRYRRSDIQRFIRAHLRYGDVAAIIERAEDP